MRKHKNGWVVALVITVLLMVCLAQAFAQEGGGSTGPVPEAAVAVATSAVDGAIDVAGGKLGWLAQVLAWMAIARLIFKPLHTFAHAVAEATPTKKDNEWLAKWEGSPVYKGVCWVVDFLASVKLPRAGGSHLSPALSPASGGEGARARPVKVPDSMSATEANQKYGERYGVDWEYRK